MSTTIELAKGYERHVVTYQCGHKFVMDINTAMPKTLIQNMLTSPAQRLCVHCQAGFPERGQFGLTVD